LRDEAEIAKIQEKALFVSFSMQIIFALSERF
jgi:hypothetical protein